MQRKRTVIPLPDYERIYRLICGVLDGRANTPHACIFFSLVGAAILEQYYKIPAQPMAGAAAYVVDAESGTASLFGKLSDGSLVSSDESFHCWIEAQGVVIDFMAPLFQESLKTYGHSVSVPPRMFQKPRSEMAQGPHLPTISGAFYLVPNPALASKLFKGFSESPASTDLANIVLHWYRRPPKPLHPEMGMHDDLGRVTKLALAGPRLEGAW